MRCCMRHRPRCSWMACPCVSCQTTSMPPRNGSAVARTGTTISSKPEPVTRMAPPLMQAVLEGARNHTRKVQFSPSPRASPRHSLSAPSTVKVFDPVLVAPSTQVDPGIPAAVGHAEDPGPRPAEDDVTRKISGSRATRLVRGCGVARLASERHLTVPLAALVDLHLERLGRAPRSGGQTELAARPCRRSSGVEGRWCRHRCCRPPRMAEGAAGRLRPTAL